ncbi:MAG: hypothetical protein ABIN67_24610 [Ferruginibacter sp.]
MPVKRTIPHNSGMFFITFTCYQWLSLIDKVNGYDIIYKWFDHLKSKGHFINGYVIMPNHVHALISLLTLSKASIPSLAMVKDSWPMKLLTGWKKIMRQPC